MKRITKFLPLILLAGCELEPDSIERGIIGNGVVINEFTAGNSGKIELYNSSSTAVDLSNWQVDDIANGGTAPKGLGSPLSLPSHGYLVVSYSGINTASTDSVRLVDANGVEVDNHSNFYAGSSTQGLCFGRKPDGGAWAAASLPCTLGATNGGSPDMATAPDLAQLPDLAKQPDLTRLPDLTQLADLTRLPDLTQLPDLATPAGAAIVTQGRRDHVRLQGMVVTADSFFDGEVLVEGDTITCVAASCAAMPAAADATLVRTGGVILPGLIDAHNHILFDIFDESDWSPPKVYGNHNQWPNDARYGAMVDAKQYLNGEGSPMNLGCEMDKYGELKGLIAGTTSIQGSANPSDKLCFGSLARTIDQGPNDLPEDKMQTATLFPTKASADGVCNNFASGKTDSYVVHVGEGVDSSALSEFGKLGTISTTPGCLYSPKTTIIHGTAFGDAEFTSMAQHGMSLVWSPRSNIFLYGAGTDLTKTANIPLALSKGITVALAPDWSIGGSQNLLDELRFAHQVSQTVWGNQLTPKLLFQMATVNAAKVLGVDEYVGTIAVGKKADLFVIGGDVHAPYDALLAATPKSVRLVMVGGAALYGDSQLKWLGAPTPGCEDLTVCTGSKFVCVAEAGGTASNKLGQSYAEISAALSAGIQSYDDMNLTQWDFAPIAPLVKCE